MEKPEGRLKLWIASGVNAAKFAQSSTTCIARMPPSHLYSVTKFVGIKVYTNNTMTPRPHHIYLFNTGFPSELFIKTRLNGFSLYTVKFHIFLT